MAASEMADLLNAFYESISTGDASPVEDCLAADVLVIGTDEVEWWQGRDEALRVMRAQVGEMHDAGLRVTGGDLQVVESGDVVWAADRPSLILEDGTAVPLRLTAVASRDGEALLFRQLHVSGGVPNEDTVQQHLTV